MYNEGIKNAFLQKAEQDGEEYIVKKKYIFNQTEPLEKEKGKDIALFSKKEVREIYTSWDLSLLSLYSTHTFLRRYAAFYIKENSGKCEILAMSQEEVREAFNERKAPKIEKNNFPVRDFINKVDELKNPADKFLMYGLFQGIRGVSNCELAFSTMEDCNTENREIWLAGADGDDVISNARRYKADEKLFNYALESSRTYEYFTYEKNREQKIELTSNRIIKTRSDVNENVCLTISAGKRRVDIRLRVLLKQIGLSDYSGLDIYKVGLAYHIKKICLEYGITDLLEVFKTKEYEKIKEQYNLTDNNRNVKRILKGFL